MKLKGQGKKEYVIRIRGSVSELMTINKAIRIMLWYERIQTKVELLHINEFFPRKAEIQTLNVWNS